MYNFILVSKCAARIPATALAFASAVKESGTKINRRPKTWRRSRFLHIKRAQNEAEMRAKAANMEPNTSQRKLKRSPKGAKSRPKCIPKSMCGKGHEKWCTARDRDHPFLEPISIKNTFKNQSTHQCRKESTYLRKNSQNDAKTMSIIDDKSMKFLDLRFLVFCEEYNVKIVFLHDQGTRNQ